MQVGLCHLLGNLYLCAIARGRKDRSRIQVPAFLLGFHFVLALMLVFLGLALCLAEDDLFNLADAIQSGSDVVTQRGGFK